MKDFESGIHDAPKWMRQRVVVIDDDIVYIYSSHVCELCEVVVANNLLDLLMT
jgi:hypothetical protein